MSLPYQDATSGERALGEIQKTLRAFGCTSFGSMLDFDRGELLVQFEWKDRKVSVKASAKGYAAAWLREHPWTHRTRASKAEHERKALQIGTTAAYSVLRDWIKGQITAVETGILTFEGAFLGQILLPNGRTVLDHIQSDNLLPAPEAKT